ncbi:MAG: helix-turn-helix domain-containing protein [Cytophagaceae bacterium]|nr:MAG: helix-turn-helix domain-containing protein [Cytophagaceae bacterium]
MNIHVHNLGESLKQFRKLKKMSQAGLAQLIGVKPQAVSEWETGKSRPDIRKLPDIAKALGVTLSELVGGEGIDPGMPLENIKGVRIGAGKTKRLPLISIRGQASIIEKSLDGCQLKFIEDYYELFLPDLELDENKHVIIEIEGDSMEPDIKNRAKVLGESIASQNVKYESNAVFAVLYAERFVLKRIKTNDIIEKGRLVLYSDNDRYGPMTVDANDLKCMWKILRVVYSPVY